MHVHLCVREMRLDLLFVELVILTQVEISQLRRAAQAAAIKEQEQRRMEQVMAERAARQAQLEEQREEAATRAAEAQQMR